MKIHSHGFGQDTSLAPTAHIYREHATLHLEPGDTLTRADRKNTDVVEEPDKVSARRRTTRDGTPMGPWTYRRNETNYVIT